VSEIEITQEDREAAEARWGIPLDDTDPDVQMLARHRQAARERALDEAAEVAELCWVETKHGLGFAQREGTAKDAASQIRKLKEG